jgi:hypothetical protein
MEIEATSKVNNDSSKPTELFNTTFIPRARNFSEDFKPIQEIGKTLSGEHPHHSLEDIVAKFFKTELSSKGVQIYPNSNYDSNSHANDLSTALTKSTSNNLIDNDMYSEEEDVPKTNVKACATTKKRSSQSAKATDGNDFWFFHLPVFNNNITNVLKGFLNYETDILYIKSETYKVQNVQIPENIKITHETDLTALEMRITGYNTDTSKIDFLDQKTQFFFPLFIEDLRGKTSFHICPEWLPTWKALVNLWNVTVCKGDWFNAWHYRIISHLKYLEREMIELEYICNTIKSKCEAVQKFKFTLIPTFADDTQISKAIENMFGVEPSKRKLGKNKSNNNVVCMSEEGEGSIGKCDEKEAYIKKGSRVRMKATDDEVSKKRIKSIDNKHLLPVQSIARNQPSTKATTKSRPNTLKNKKMSNKKGKEDINNRKENTILQAETIIVPSESSLLKKSICKSAIDRESRLNKRSLNRVEIPPRPKTGTKPGRKSEVKSELSTVTTLIPLDKSVGDVLPVDILEEVQSSTAVTCNLPDEELKSHDVGPAHTADDASNVVQVSYKDDNISNVVEVDAKEIVDNTNEEIATGVNLISHTNFQEGQDSQVKINFLGIKKPCAEDGDLSGSTSKKSKKKKIKKLKSANSTEKIIAEEVITSDNSVVASAVQVSTTSEQGIDPVVEEIVDDTKDSMNIEESIKGNDHDSSNNSGNISIDAKNKATSNVGSTQELKEISKLDDNSKCALSADKILPPAKCEKKEIFKGANRTLFSKMEQIRIAQSLTTKSIPAGLQSNVEKVSNPIQECTEKAMFLIFQYNLRSGLTEKTSAYWLDPATPFNQILSECISLKHRATEAVRHWREDGTDLRLQTLSMLEKKLFACYMCSILLKHN